MYDANKNELDIIAYWESHQCFEKSVSQRPESKPYVFYDGPPFATGLPHYGHIVASLMKDVVPRYWTMRGYQVERKWGWDCHGLPIENIIEKDLNLNSKKDIENFGVDKFNEACNATVLKYAGEWKKTIRRMGRWVDMENDYKTMDVGYMESAWWVFKELWKKDLVYKGHKAMHICPRCVTPLSNFEVTQGYKDLKDISVIVKFKITDQKFLEKYCNVVTTSFVAWTTTPWSIPTTMGLAVGPDFDYVLVKIGDEQVIGAQARLDFIAQHLEAGNFEVVKTFKGSEILGVSYVHPFAVEYAERKEVAENKLAYKTHGTDYVSIEDGTGIVTINGAFGEIDYNAAKKIGLPIIVNVKMDGTYTEEMGALAGRQVKPKEDPTAMDVEIIKILASRGALYRKEKYTHSYPHCWRCDTPLLNYLTDCWFIKVTELKDQLLKNNEAIHWVPENFKQGRFGEWLAGARDWAVSRNRYWGNPLPVWESEDGDHICVGSVAELEELCGQKVGDLHKQFVDKLEITKDGKVYHRVPEVLDCWFESGSMPYGQMHYPFENREKFEAGFPAQFIAEGQDQTRGWFYTLHVLATALTSGKNPSIPKKKTCPAFNNVIVNGIVLAEDGKKMSKRLKNYPEPDLMIAKYGADAMRYYLVTAPVMEAQALNFSEVGVREMYNKLVNTLWNVVEFYKMYASDGNQESRIKNQESENVLDKWILAKLNLLVKDVTEGMENYELVKASRPIVEFVTELSQWYVRRSRDRFKGGNNTVILSETKDPLKSTSRDSSAAPQNDKQQAISTLREVLLTLSKVMAPFTPFMAEKIYLEMGGKKESVHLEAWPEFKKEYFDEQVIKDMDVVRKIVELGLALRAEVGIKVKQPLAKLTINNEQLTSELKEIIADELNVKEVVAGESGGENWVIKEDSGLKVALNTAITPALKAEGTAREVVRAINQIRKDKALTINDQVAVKYQTNSSELLAVFTEHAEYIKKSVLANSLEAGNADRGVEVEIGGAKVRLSVDK